MSWFSIFDCKLTYVTILNTLFYIIMIIARGRHQCLQAVIIVIIPVFTSFHATLWENSTMQSMWPLRLWPPAKNTWFKLFETETLLDPPHVSKGRERIWLSGDPRGHDTHLDEGVVTNLREMMTSQRTNFQNCVFELTFPHSQGTKTSAG